MQDRYAGDVGDFMKLGLLRHLATSPEAGGTGLTIGLNWYRAPNEAHNADGKHIGYLKASNRWHSSLAACDPDLIRCLRGVVDTERSVQALERSGALPVGSPTFSEMLDPGWTSASRHAWHRRALDAIASADVVFADPDNGLCLSASRPKLHKYAPATELANYAQRGQSLVTYHHADRSDRAETQAGRHLEELAAGVRQVPIAAVIARRGSCRFFLITAAEAHRESLCAALDNFETRWAPHATLVRTHVNDNQGPF
jgi:hypothetical protein